MTRIFTRLITKNVYPCEDVFLFTWACSGHSAPDTTVRLRGPHASVVPHMSKEPHSQPHAAAIAELEAFRLSTYAARTFVALSTIGTATAKEVSQVADVPRTRVYDAVDELQMQGLVSIEAYSPKQFIPVSPETVRRKFRAETTHRLARLMTALYELEADTKQIKQRGIWTVDGEAAVTDRIVAFITAADEEISYLASDRIHSKELVDGLAVAAESDISVSVGGLSEAGMSQLQREIPCATRLTTDVGMVPIVHRLIVVDGSKALISTRTETQKSEPKAETAIWCGDDQNSLVTISKALLSQHTDQQ